MFVETLGSGLAAAAGTGTRRSWASYPAQAVAEFMTRR